MKNESKLLLIKLAHTVIWCVFVCAIFYILHAGVFDKVSPLVWICVGLVALEGAVLLACKWKCPLTLLGQKYADDHRPGFDIFLPAWLAKNNKFIFSVLFCIGLVLVLWRVLQNYFG